MSLSSLYLRLQNHIHYFANVWVSIQCNCSCASMGSSLDITTIGLSVHAKCRTTHDEITNIIKLCFNYIHKYVWVVCTHTHTHLRRSGNKIRITFVQTYVFLIPKHRPTIWRMNNLYIYGDVCMSVCVKQ